MTRAEFQEQLHTQLQTCFPFKDERPIIDCIESITMSLLEDNVHPLTVKNAINTYLDAYANNQ